MRKMTEGAITPHLLSCAIPMILGNLLQLTYNAVDSIIIGKVAGEDALAAVSVANPVMTIVILGVSGLSIGASVLMGQFYGAQDNASLKRELSTTILSGAVCSLIVFLVGLFFSRPILQWMNVPAAALDMAETYLRIIFVGFLFTFQYNILSGALRSIGDAKTPVWFLGISAVLNTLLDLLLIGVFGMGVAGAGLATVLAEGVSAMLCAVRVYRHVPCLQLRRKDWVLDRALLKETWQSGALTALQQSAQPIGKVLIQGVVNGQGIAAIAAFNAVCRLDDFACIPSQSIGHSIMTCVAQNRGAGRIDRVRESLRKGLLLGLCWFPIICAITLAFKEPFVHLLSPDGSDEIVRLGVAYLSVKAFMFIMPCVNNAIQGFFRGIGKMQVTLLATCIQISLRTLTVFMLVPRVGIVGEAWGCLLGWGCQCAFELIIYFRMRHSEKLSLGVGT